MKLILHSNKLPTEYDEDVLAERHRNMLASGHFLAVYIEDREGDEHEVRITLSEPEAVAAYAAGKRPIDYFIDQNVRQLVEAFEAGQEAAEDTGDAPDTPDATAPVAADEARVAQEDKLEKKLGILSARYESNGDPGAYGFDRHGGPSYGAYQFASKRGSMANFLNALKNSKPDFFAVLQAAGGDAAARAGSAAFKTAWKKLATEHRELFFRMQHAYIKSSHYDLFVRKVKQQIDLDVDVRSLALRNVAWSVAVQHGPGNGIFRSALQGRDLSDDARIIRWVYAERSKVTKHFRSSTKAVQNAVKARFDRELRDALEMLAQETA